MEHRNLDELRSQLAWIEEAPADGGIVRLIVRRPTIDEREILEEGQIDERVGLEGDNWLTKGSSSTPDGSAHPDGQVTVTSWRAMYVLAGAEERVPLAGDQLFVDLDISFDNLPEGTLLAIGTAVLRVTAKPHKGCAKFGARFGADALRFVNLGRGRELRLRGINTKVEQSGKIRAGDAIVVTRPTEAYQRQAV